MRAKKSHGKVFGQIYNIIGDLGYKHTSNFLVKADPQQFYQRSPADERRFYIQMVKQMKDADVCVFEISRHSLGIGYAVNLSLEFGKPTLLLYQANHKPYLFSAIKSDRLMMVEYTTQDLAETLQDALEEAKNHIDIRFTFFITPKINEFLRFIIKNKKTPRAVYLRSMLEREMKKEGF
jgi:hypothetical protein